LLGSKGVLRVLANIDVASQLGATALVDDVVGNLLVTDDSRVLLARVDGRAVASNVGADYISGFAVSYEIPLTV